MIRHQRERSVRCGRATNSKRHNRRRQSCRWSEKRCARGGCLSPPSLLWRLAADEDVRTRGACRRRHRASPKAIKYSDTADGWNGADCGQHSTSKIGWRQAHRFFIAKGQVDTADGGRDPALRQIPVNLNSPACGRPQRLLAVNRLARRSCGAVWRRMIW